MKSPRKIVMTILNRYGLIYHGGRPRRLTSKIRAPFNTLSMETAADMMTHLEIGPVVVGSGGSEHVLSILQKSTVELQNMERIYLDLVFTNEGTMTKKPTEAVGGALRRTRELCVAIAPEYYTVRTPIGACLTTR